MLITSLRLQVALSQLAQSTMGWDTTTTRCPILETQASISKQSIQTKVVTEQMGKTDTHNIMYRSKSRQSGESVTMAQDASPCDSGDEAYGFWTQAGWRKMGSRALCQYPFDQNSFFFHAIFWLFPVILFLKGECNVPPKISVTLKKKRKTQLKKQTNRKNTSLRTLEEILSFQMYFQTRHIALFCHFSQKRKMESTRPHKRSLIKQKDWSLRAYTARLPSGQLLAIRKHMAASAYCSWWLWWSVCVSSAGNRKFPVCGNHPVYAQAERHWVFKEYRYPRKLLLSYMERYERISLCTPC